MTAMPKFTEAELCDIADQVDAIRDTAGKIAGGDIARLQPDYMHEHSSAPRSTREIVRDIYNQACSLAQGYRTLEFLAMVPTPLRHEPLMVARAVLARAGRGSAETTTY
jgi:hypothetical protein